MDLYTEKTVAFKNIDDNIIKIDLILLVGFNTYKLR